LKLIILANVIHKIACAVAVKPREETGNFENEEFIHAYKNKEL
jgi:hypothetical protein